MADMRPQNAMEARMRAAQMVKGSLMSIPALAGLGLVACLVFAADRTADGNPADALCTKLNIGGEGCDRAYLTKTGFDEIFAEVEAASKRSAKDAAVFAEKLRLVGAKRLGPASPTDRFIVVRTRIASSDSALTLLGIDSTLRTTRIDQGAIFSFLIQNPVPQPGDTRVSETPAPDSGT
jgi:hypothetical protein